MTLAPCIYCRSTTPHRTREHVLQAGLGGVATLPVEVCAECNAAFSTMDKRLIEHVHLFALRSAKQLSGLGLMEDLDAGVRLSVILRLEGGSEVARLPPQAYRNPAGTWRFVASDESAFEAFFRDLAQPTPNVSIRYESDSDGSLPIPLTIVKTAPRTFLVRGTDADELFRVAEEIRTVGIQTTTCGQPTASSHFQPKIESAVSFPVGETSRAFAKIALNYLCFLFGTESALRFEFDPIRRYARFGEGTLGEHVVLSALTGGPSGPEPYADPRRHALVLQEVCHQGTFRVAVQAVVHGYSLGIVRFPATPQAMLPSGTWRVSYFDHVAKSVEHLRVPDDGTRCFANIEALLPGISAQTDSV